jgi:hypothetical protein
MTDTNKWYVTKGDLPSFPYKVTTGQVCTDCRTLKEANRICARYNSEEMS